MSRPDKGREGEDLAAEHLRELGLEVVERNVRCRLGEIDIVARDGRHLVFVEVKSRYADDGILPEQLVTLAKQRQLSKLAVWYLKSRNLLRQSARFDVIAITWRGDDPSINRIVNAFPLRRA